jgi:hypothetical protein
MRNIPSDNGPAWLGSVRKILVIQLAPFGDVLLTTSYFESLKERMPGAKLHYLVKEPYHKIVENHPFIDRILILRKRTGIRYILERLRLFKRIHDLRFDLVIDQQNLPSTQEMVLFSGARYRLGYEDERFRFVYNLRAKRGKVEYSASERFSILGPLGIARRKYRLYFTVPDDAARTMDSWLAGEKLSSKPKICISGVRCVENGNRALRAARGSHPEQAGAPRHPPMGAEGAGRANGSRLMKTEAVMAPATDLQRAARPDPAMPSAHLQRRRNEPSRRDDDTPAPGHFRTTNPDYWSPAGEYSDRHHHLFNPHADSKADDSFGITPETALPRRATILRRQPRKAHEQTFGRHHRVQRREKHRAVPEVRALGGRDRGRGFRVHRRHAENLP